MKTTFKIALLVFFAMGLLFCKKDEVITPEEDLSLLTSMEAIKNCVSLDTNSVAEIFKVVEQMPRFISEECENLEFLSQKLECANEKLASFIGDNIIYPQVAIDNNIEGEVAVIFVINKGGCHSAIRIAQEDIGYGCGIELQRVVSTLPDFIPGRQRGKEVRVQFVIRYEFKL